MPSLSLRADSLIRALCALALMVMSCSDSASEEPAQSGGGGGPWDPDAVLEPDGGIYDDQDVNGFASETNFSGPVTADEACERWRLERDGLVPGSWSGAQEGCQAGELSEEGHSSALVSINLYRWLAGLPPVETDSARDVASQQCALMIEVNGELNNSPPGDWQCLTPAGKEAVVKSLLAFEDAIAAVDYFVVNPTDALNLASRRALLSTSLGPIGIGSTGESTCVLTGWGSAEVDRLFVAWPPGGVVPVEAVSPGFGSIDETGWSVHSDTMDLSSATVVVTQGGQVMPVSTRVLEGKSGSPSGIAFTPEGWTALGWITYRVEVSGVSEPFAYEVQTVVCP